MQDMTRINIQYPVPPRGARRFNPVVVWRYLKHVEKFFATLKAHRIYLAATPAKGVVLQSERLLLEGQADFNETRLWEQRRKNALRRTTKDASLFL